MAQRNSTPPQRLSNPPPSDPRTATPRARTFAVLPATDNWTLAALRDVLGSPDPELAAVLLRAFSDETFVKYGRDVSSERLLRAAPTIVSTTLQTLASLSPANLALVHLPPGIFAVIVDEALKVPALAAPVTAVAKKATVSHVAWSASRKTARQGAIAARDRVVRALGSALGAAHAEVVKATAGNAEDDAALAEGMIDLADFIDHTLAEGSREERTALAHFCVDAACVTQLRESIRAVQAVGDAPMPVPYNALVRALNLQEGRVLALLDMVVGAMRSARASNKAIPLPELGPLQSWLIPPRGKRKSKGGGEGGASGADR